jgi:preprotein translocase subunit SecA
LNAKQHEREAHIIQNAGQKNSVTIATNMAGRGTDIKLGVGVKELGGLFIIGTERHEARRIDNQLRGRAGRQGDPGASQFYVSLEDELMRRFGGERMQSMMTTLGLPDNEPIQNGLISKTIESAQSKIEGYNFDTRKHVLEYDDVMNKQREVVYRKRKSVLRASEFRDETLKLLSEEFDHLIAFHCAGEDALWQVDDIVSEVNGLAPDLTEKKILEKLTSIRDDRSKDEMEKRSLVLEHLISELKVVYSDKEKLFSKETWDNIQRGLYLRSLDTLWMNHLDEIDYLRQGIGLRGIAQKDPLIEYKREAYDMFLGLMDSVRKTFLSTLLKLKPNVEIPQEEKKNLQFTGASEDTPQFERKMENGSTEKQKPLHKEVLIGRNDPCSCGSGLKYKRCGMIGAKEHTQLA